LELQSYYSRKICQLLSTGREDHEAAHTEYKGRANNYLTREENLSDEGLKENEDFKKKQKKAVEFGTINLGMQ
jgi:hypothetical protein